MSPLHVSLWVTLFTAPLTQAQDRFPDPIPASDVSVSVKAVATIPDSRTNNPPRLHVLTQDPGGRLFVNDQRGVLYTFDEATGTVTEYLDLRDYPSLAISAGLEDGFQGFAFHPDFLNPGTDGYGRLYTIFSSNDTSQSPDFDPGGSTAFHTLLVEWRADSPETDVFAAADPSAPFRELMRLKQPYGNHNAGLVAFNPLARPGHPDYGNLYIAIGDGGSGGDPQENGEDPSNPFGAILRIDPLGNDSANGQYGIVMENALAADEKANTLAEIYCFGLRNPQRFGWDFVTGAGYIADIGQNAVEEINLLANGAHYGWDIREGSFPFEGNTLTGLTDPVAEYDHTGMVASLPAGISGGRAVTVSGVARGTCITGLDGHLVLADFPTGTPFILNVDDDPLNGGQDGLRELVLLNQAGSPTRFLEMMNEARGARGLGFRGRADLRFSVNTPGRIYLINKGDGIVRRMIPDQQPFLSIDASGEKTTLSHTGILQSSPDLSTWSDLVPQPDGALELMPDDPASAPFWRSIKR
ncbi:MAG: PQQ-dependent sugar dehydrogenase [Oceanipulchritudo sp.]